MAIKTGQLIGSAPEYPMLGTIKLTQEDSGKATLLFEDFRSVRAHAPQIHLTQSEDLNKTLASLPLPRANGSFEVCFEEPIRLEECDSIVIRCEKTSAILGTAEINE